MSLRKIVLLWLVLPLCVASFAQPECTSTFSGQVYDEIGIPMMGATIILGNRLFIQVSDENGKFEFHNLCSRKYSLIVQFVGYQSFETEIIIKGVDLVQQIVMQPSTEQLGEVVVRAHQAQTEHAHNLTTINTGALAEAAGKSLGEALKEIPGVNTIQAGPGIFKPVIHGLHSQRILILNYGIRQEGQQWGAEHAPEIDPFIASNIVVIKDATAIKYGTDALGGVIVVNPPELPEKPGLGGTLFSVAQSNGRSGTLSGYVEGGIKNHEGWGWRVQGTTKKSGDYHAPQYSLTNTGMNEFDFSAAVGLHKKNFGFEVFFSQFKTTLGILKGTAISNLSDLLQAMENEPPASTTAFSYSIGAPRQEVSHNLFKINAHHETKGGEWRLQYGYQDNDRKEFDIRRGALTEIPSMNLSLQTHTLEVEWEKENSKKETLCLGITGMAQKNTNIPGTQRIPFIPNFATFSGGAFGVAKFYVAKWVMDGGLRYDYRVYQVKGFDYKNSNFDDALSFGNLSLTLGASLPISTKQSLHFNASSAWRPPHVAELYSLGTHQSAASIEYGLLLNDQTNEVMKINSVSFKNEQAIKLIGTHQYSGKRLQNEITLYGNWISNFIYLKPTGVTQNIRGVYPYFRYAQTDALFVGADISTSANVLPYLRARQNISLIQVSNRSGLGHLPFIPPNRLDWSLRLDDPKRFFLKKFFLQGKAIWVAKQERAPRVITPKQIVEAQEQGIDLFATDKSNFDFAAAPSSYWLFNMSGGFSMWKGKLDFSLAVENLLNKSYREYTNRFRYYADDRGRSFILSIKVDF
jgi:iron complex outermembrane recepter protein